MGKFRSRKSERFVFLVASSAFILVRPQANEKVQSTRGKIRRMFVPTSTYLFYLFAFSVGTIPTLFVGHYWYEARNRGWNLVNEHTQTMYANGAQTMIIAAGVPVALLASSTVTSAKSSNALIAFSAKVAVVCLISCVCLSLLLILALLRGFERAQLRRMDEQRNAGEHLQAGEGRFHAIELVLILIPTWLALTCFLVGFVFLGRVAYHF